MPIQRHSSGRAMVVNTHASRFGTMPEDRTPAIEAEIGEFRAARATALDESDRSTIDHNISLLQDLLERSKTNDAARSQQVAALEAKQAEERERVELRRQSADDQLKAEKRATFLASNPTATESDFERLWPQLRDQHFIEQQNAAIAQAKASGRYSI